MVGVRREGVIIIGVAAVAADHEIQRRRGAPTTTNPRRVEKDRVGRRID